jgi:hypothetical protein
VEREDFGVSFHRVLDHGGLALGENVAITIEIEATASAEAKDPVATQPVEQTAEAQS